MSKIKLGVDLGNTCVYKDNEGKPIIFDNCIECLSKLSVLADIYIVSRVNIEQEIRSKRWLIDSWFLYRAGISWDKLYYCREREDKADIVKALGINYFIDDRPEVLSFMELKVKGMLFRPIESHLEKFLYIKNNCPIFNNWNDVYRYIIDDLDKNNA